MNALVRSITIAAVLFASQAFGQRLALTFDDGPDMADNIGLTAAERNSALLAQLADAHLKTFLFVTEHPLGPGKGEGRRRPPLSRRG